MSFRLRAAVDREVFRARRYFVILGIVTLQSANHRGSQFARQEGIFAKRFLTAPPTGITEYVHIRRPEGEPLVLSASTRCCRGVMFRARFIGNRAGDAVHE